MAHVPDRATRRSTPAPARPPMRSWRSWPGWKNAAAQD